MVVHEFSAIVLLLVVAMASVQGVSRARGRSSEQEHRCGFMDWILVSGGQVNGVEIAEWGHGGHRGVQTTRAVRAGEVLVSLPPHLLMSVEDLQVKLQPFSHSRGNMGFNSKRFSIHNRSTEPRINEIIDLALWLTLEASLEDSRWGPYLCMSRVKESIPSEDSAALSVMTADCTDRVNRTNKETVQRRKTDCSLAHGLHSCSDMSRQRAEAVQEVANAVRWVLSSVSMSTLLMEIDDLAITSEIQHRQWLHAATLMIPSAVSHTVSRQFDQLEGMAAPTIVGFDFFNDVSELMPEHLSFSNLSERIAANQRWSHTRMQFTDDGHFQYVARVDIDAWTEVTSAYAHSVEAMCSAEFKFAHEYLPEGCAVALLGGLTEEEYNELFHLECKELSTQLDGAELFQAQEDLFEEMYPSRLQRQFAHDYLPEGCAPAVKPAA